MHKKIYGYATVRSDFRRYFLMAVALMSLSIPIDLAFAIDMDIAINDIQRRETAAPFCPTVTSKSGELSTVDEYHKGLCLLYGIQGKPQREAALPFLRKAADSNLAEAQLALADTLQSGNAEEQKEALKLYQSAGLAEDKRATQRAVRLSGRIAASTAKGTPIPPPGDIADPASQEIQSKNRDGYHCHMMPFGKRWCHSTSDY